MIRYKIIRIPEVKRLPYCWLVPVWPLKKISGSSIMSNEFIGHSNNLFTGGRMKTREFFFMFFLLFFLEEIVFAQGGADELDSNSTTNTSEAVPKETVSVDDSSAEGDSSYRRSWHFGRTGENTHRRTGLYPEKSEPWW